MKNKEQDAPQKDNKKSEEKLNIDVSSNLHENMRILKETFDKCSDVVIRSLKVGENPASLMYIDGLVDNSSIQLHAIHRLLSKIEPQQVTPEYLEEQVISINKVVEATKLDDVTKQILAGNTILFVDSMAKAMVFNARGGETRSVSEPETETAVRGPREGFTENIRVNTSLIRNKIKSSRLKIISKEVGTETNTNVDILYMDGLAEQSLVEEVEKRIDQIQIDGILESGYIEELIEDSPSSFFPQIQNTERPDTVAANLLEGRVAILVSGTPFCLILPTTFWQFLQASEDYYNRFHISIFLRWLRFIFILIALLLPALYIAVSTYHPEMIPSNLLYSIAASRESIPFPAFVEAMIMEVAFEALREAGIRLPKPVGQAVSILGALVIGQAAVQAGIVSAPMVIIVSLTGIASFTIPRFNMAISIRLLRFPLMLLAGMFGLFGIVLGLLFIITHLCKLRSFGVPYLSPLAPLTVKDLKDVFIRVPWWKMNSRPNQTNKENAQRESSS
ncbi:spore germination protein [Bacillus carboniphilus]|uniref:Spore germination protein n=1 Tax=Bacillus carboniphilus TaxID=86663 RepID=A0ABN0VQP9_9BACI